MEEVLTKREIDLIKIKIKEGQSRLNAIIDSVSEVYWENRKKENDEKLKKYYERLN